MTGSHLVLRPATTKEVHYIHDLNSSVWAGGLTVEMYHARERTLASIPLTRNGGWSAWVLVNSEELWEVLSSCETIKKDAFVSRLPVNGGVASSVKQVTAHCVGNVFTPVEHRGKGYAGIMLQLLAETLRDGNADGFNVLYSDIGKVCFPSGWWLVGWMARDADADRKQKFYASFGWLPHRSTHLEFPAIEEVCAPIAGVKPLRSTDVPSLCVKDVAALTELLSRPHTSANTRIAFVPDYQTMEWHWTREEFVAPVLRKHMDIEPEIKGAIAADGKRWFLWNRDFGKKSSQLFIIRYVNLSRSLSDVEEENHVSKLFRAAGIEAHKWGLKKVTMWNPDEICIRAARRVAGPAARVVGRETDSICSVMMHPKQQGSGPEDVDWVANEKYAWC